MGAAHRLNQPVRPLPAMGDAVEDEGDTQMTTTATRTAAPYVDLINLHGGTLTVLEHEGNWRLLTDEGDPLTGENRRAQSITLPQNGRCEIRLVNIQPRNLKLGLCTAVPFTKPVNAILIIDESKPDDPVSFRIEEGDQRGLWKPAFTSWLSRFGWDI